MLLKIIFYSDIRIRGKLFQVNCGSSNSYENVSLEDSNGNWFSKSTFVFTKSTFRVHVLSTRKPFMGRKKGNFGKSTFRTIHRSKV